MNSIPITPGCSGKKAGWLHISGVAKIQRCFPRIPGKFSTLINTFEVATSDIPGAKAGITLGGAVIGNIMRQADNLPGPGLNVVANKPNLNSNNATSNFGIYEIHVNEELYKVGKADLNRVTQTSGLPTRLHQQVRKLENEYGIGNVEGQVVQKLGEVTTKEAKALENARIQGIVEQTGIVPIGNRKSYKP